MRLPWVYNIKPIVINKQTILILIIYLKKRMKTKFLSAIAITSLLFASCSNDDNDTTKSQDGNIVKFSSSVSGSQLRVGGAAGDEWAAGDKVGIFMRDNTSKAVQSNNIEYTAGSLTNGDKDAVLTSTTPIYYPVNTPAKVDFIAYHPYTATLANTYEYAVNVATQTDQSAIDLMIATADNATAGYDKTNTSAVNLNFSHQLSKVVINVTAGAGVTSLSGLTVKINGMNTTATFDISTATLSAEGNPAAITTNNPSGSNFEAILLPLAAFTASNTLEFTIGSDTYTWAMNTGTTVTQFDGGKKYIFNATLKKNAVEITGSIQPWGNGGTETIVAE